MLSVDDFRKRASSIYDGQHGRQKRQLMKSVPKGVVVVIPSDEILPYTRAEFQAWLWKQVGLQVIQCPYCTAPIDVLSLVVDHKVPLKLGGSIGLDNQEPICATCNGAKGKLIPAQYAALIAFVRTLGPVAESDIISRLKMGSGYLRTAFINRKTANSSQPPTSGPRHLQTRINLDDF